MITIATVLHTVLKIPLNYNLYILDNFLYSTKPLKLSIQHRRSHYLKFGVLPFSFSVISIQYIKNKTHLLTHCISCSKDIV